MKTIYKISAFINTLLSSLQIFLQSVEKIPIGGQAVIEGVLMKGPSRWGLSVRKPSGEIWSEHWTTRALNRSAELYLGEEEKITFGEMLLSVVVALVAVVGLFIAFPVWISEFLARTFGYSTIVQNLLEGAMRGLVFILYVGTIGLWKDIREVFRYHGAEHKTINAFENGAEMTPSSVTRYSRIHPRCGTSFLLVVVAVSIIVFSFVAQGSLLWKALTRVLLLPLVIGISYEFIRFSSRSTSWGRYLIFPALSLQYLTTREPNEQQIEVALSSLESALDRKL